jgi:thiol:disulfide interchange protein DsbD
VFRLSPIVFFLFAVLLSQGQVQAQDPVRWTFSRNGQGDVVASATVKDGWHVYATELPRDDGPFPTVFNLGTPDRTPVPFRLAEPEPEVVDDPNFGMVVRYHSGSPVFRLVPDDRVRGGLIGSVEYMVCNDVTCLPPKLVAFTLPEVR